MYVCIIDLKWIWRSGRRKVVEYVRDNEIRVEKGILIRVDSIDMAVGKSIRRAEVLSVAVDKRLILIWMGELLGRTAKLHYRII